MAIEPTPELPDSPAMAAMKQKLSRMETPAGRQRGLAYPPRPDDDVAIATTPKAGTTWMQQICHQLRSNGDMTFEEISGVVPFIELSSDIGQDLEAEQPYGPPRLFKTHCWANHCPPFARTIVVMRHPYDVLVSFYHFFEDWFFEPGTISLDEFATQFWLTRDSPESKVENASYFAHLVSWYRLWQAQATDQRVMLVFFEDLKSNLELQVRRVAAFLSTDQYRVDTEERIQAAIANSTFQFMKLHEPHFDEHLTKHARNAATGLAPEAGLRRSKIRSGDSHGATKPMLSDHIKALIDARWAKVVEPVTGCANYEALRAQLQKHCTTI